jgi:hypothetical protein
MAGPGETLGNPWLPLAIRLYAYNLRAFVPPSVQKNRTENQKLPELFFPDIYLPWATMGWWWTSWGAWGAATVGRWPALGARGAHVMSEINVRAEVGIWWRWHRGRSKFTGIEPAYRTTHSISRVPLFTVAYGVGCPKW